jgi:hypothetical protein
MVPRITVLHTTALPTADQLMLVPALPSVVYIPVAVMATDMDTRSTGSTPEAVAVAVSTAAAVIPIRRGTWVLLREQRVL